MSGAPPDPAPAVAWGGTAVSLLADRANRAIIVTLGDAQGSPRSAASIVAASPVGLSLKLRLIRDRLRELERGGVVSAADVDPAEHGPGLHWALTTSGRDLHRLHSVMEHVAADAAGLGERTPAHERDRVLERTLGALADPAVARIVAALAAGTELDPTELEARCRPTSRRTLYRRLDLLVSGGVVSRDTTRGVPRRTRYAIAPSWRQAAVLPLLAAWWESRHGAADDPIDVAGPLRIILPAVRADQLPAGAQALWVVEQGDLSQRIVLEVGERGLRMGTEAGQADAVIEGPPQGWTGALVADRLGDVRMTGDEALARAVLAAVRAALFASVR